MKIYVVCGKKETYVLSKDAIKAAEFFKQKILELRDNNDFEELENLDFCVLDVTD